ncbi:MAG TPA: choice-of-anchor U domain-containing protein, partial [Gammaproteobacteria bacterium]
AITITDADSTQLNQATVDISTNFNSAQDELVYSTINGITGVYSSITGTLTLSGTATLAEYEQALESVTYQNNSDDPTTGARTIVFQVRDTDNTSSLTDSISLSIVVSNDVPAIAGSGGTLAYTENAAATTIDNTITVTDLDDSNLSQATIQIVTACNSSEDRIEISGATCTTNGITCTPTLGSCLLTLTTSQPLLNYRNVLRAITYRNLSDNPVTTTRVVRMQLTDDTSGVSNLYDKSISVGATNDAPVIGGVDNIPTYTEAGPAVTIDSSITVTDPDSTCTQATIDLSTNYLSTEDVLQYAGAVAGISAGAFNSGTGTLTLTGTVACSDYGTALSAMRYINTSLDPSTAARTVVFQVTDSSGGTLSNAPTTTITVSAASTAPTVSDVDNVAVYTENGASVVIDSSVTLTDPDSASLNQATVSITGNYNAAQDQLLYSPTLHGVTIFSNAGGILTLTGTATKAQYEEVLESVRFQNTADNPSNFGVSARTIAFSVRDTSNVTTITPDSTTLNINVTNDAPVMDVDNSSAANFTENDATGVIIDSTITITDAESNSITGGTVSITANFNTAQDQLVYSTVNGITGAYDGGTGVLTLSHAGTSLANFEQALESVRYRNTSDNPTTGARTVSFAVTDNGTNNTGGVSSSAPLTSVADTASVAITATNDVPVISGVNNIAGYIENGAEVTIDSDVSITDLDSTQLNQATVSISGNFAAGQDQLIYPAVIAGITDSYNALTGVLTLSHTTSASLANFELALESVQYLNSSDDPSELPRTISMVVRDTAGGSSVADTTTLNVTATNDRPDAVDDLFSVAVNSSTVSLDVLDNDIDVDSGDTKTLLSVDAPNNGGTTEIGNGSNCTLNTVCYTPPADFTGINTFSYAMEDSGNLQDLTPPTVTIQPTDTDGDLLIDYLDNCPLVSNAGQENNDADSEGDACDDDDDNDGMDDTFEDDYSVECGLDPFDASDATEDCDGDGLNNVGEADAASDPTVDDVDPIFNGIEDIAVDSTGYLTPVDIGDIEAVDTAEGTVDITIDSVTGSTDEDDALNGLFRPGRTVINRSAEDSLNNTANSAQTIDVRPLANFTPDQIGVEGGSVQIDVLLNGAAAEYPVTLDYTVSGSSNGADHDAVSGVLTINDPDIAGSIIVNLTDDGPGEPNQTLILTLSNPVNAVLGGKRTHTVTITEGNVAPTVTLSVLQGANDGATVIADQGDVTITTDVDDPNPGSTFTYSWFSDLIQTNPAGGPTFVFDSTGLTPGMYPTTVQVTDNGGASRTAEVFISVLADAPDLDDGNDADGDGIDDDDEGYSDDDGDGIANYLDAYEDTATQSHLIQNQVGDDADPDEDGMQLQNVKLIQTEPGLGIRKGPIAVFNNVGGVMLGISDIIDYVDFYAFPTAATDDMTNVGGFYDFEIYGLQPGRSARVVIPLLTKLLSGARYRKFNLDDGWHNFSTAGGNAIASTQSTSGLCPAPGHASYRSGLHAFDDCVQLTLVDGGANDADGTADGVIRDPGGAAVSDPSPGPDAGAAPDDGSNGGGILHPLWLLLLALWGIFRNFRIYKSRRINNY